MIKKSFYEILYISFGIMLLLVLFSVIYSVYMNNKIQYYSNDVAKNWFPSVNAQSKLLYDFLQISNKGSSIISNFLGGNTLAEEDKNELINRQNKFFDDLEKYKKNLMANGIEENFTKDVYNSWKTYKNNLDKDLKIIEKNPHEAYRHFKLETEKSSSLVAESISKEIDFNYNQGVEALKQGGYFTNITNFYMAFLIMISLIISVIVFLKIRRTTSSISGTNNAQGSFYNITENIEKLSGIIQEISEAVRKQESGVMQISLAMSQIDKVSKNNQESESIKSNSAKKLFEEVEILNNSVKNIEILINGKTRK